MTNWHSLGDINSRNVFSPSSGGCKSELGVSAGLVSSDTSLLASQRAGSSLSAHGLPAVHVCVNISP